MRTRNRSSTRAERTASQSAWSSAQSRAAWPLVSWSPGISRYRGGSLAEIIRLNYYLSMTFRAPRQFLLCCVISISVAGSDLFAQHAGPTSGESLRLPDLQRQALETDARLRQLQLEEQRTALRLDNIAAERLPALAIEGQAQHQSDVPTVPSMLPGAQRPFSPPKDQYDAYLRVDQPVLDPAIEARRAVERAQLAENQARVRTTLFTIRQDVNAAFFSAALLQARTAALEAAIADLEARLDETNVRVREGAALAAEAQAIEATLLQRRQDAVELRGNRVAALARLSALTRRQISEDDELVVPDLLAAVATTRAALPEMRERPEYEQFARMRERLERQQDVVAAQDLPRLSAFARAGYARPGLTVFGDRFDAYWLAGARLSWRFWNWGSSAREQELLRVQQEILRADEAAFTDALQRSVQEDLAAIDRLQAVLVLDEQIIALRESVERTARIRLDEGVITASEYVDRTTEVLDARIQRSRHRVELAQAAARFLTAMGVEVR